jgi:hypothetical protein
LWDVSEPKPGTEVRLLSGNHGGVRALALSGDGKTVAMGTYEGRVILLNVAKSKELRHWTLPGGLQGLAFAVDGRHLICLLGNGSLYVMRLTPPPDPSRRPGW